MLRVPGKNAVELDVCFTYNFPLLQGFGWKTSSVSYVFAVFPPFATEKPMFFVNVRDLGVQGHVGIPGMFSLGKWRQGGDDFWREVTQLDGQSLSTYGDYIFNNYPFQGTCFVHDFWGGYDFIHIYTESTFQGVSIKP